MDKFLYTAVSGATRNLSQQQIHANNLANVNTDGFRQDLERAQSEQLTGEGYSSRVLVQAQNGGVDMTSGSVHETGRNLDVAIKGSGLIALREGNREVYTRNGHIEMGPDGALTVNGLPVVGDNGPIILPTFKSVSIGNDGIISVIPDDGDTTQSLDVDRLKLVNVPDGSLSKDANGFLFTTALRNPRNEAVEVASGHLETSNVSAMGEMIASLSLNRQFEAQIKMMKAAEDLANAGNKLLNV
ncbi:flagellar basal body rod protein FlgF [Enterobacter ludwigii]|uniref:flagellar basal body rod protein FlgF n=1 Tax=Enterobacter ludwigii TaxID=299767 RepID=UPI003F7177DD